MDNENFNEDEFSSFVLPESFLNEIFEFSGSTDGNRGFLLAFVNQEGSPMIFTKTLFSLLPSNSP